MHAFILKQQNWELLGLRERRDGRDGPDVAPVCFMVGQALQRWPGQTGCAVIKATWLAAAKQQSVTRTSLDLTQTSLDHTFVQIVIHY